jgi:hypothetical protein
MGAQSLWVTVACTTIESVLLLWGVYNMNRLLLFCASADASRQYSFVKNTLILTLYTFPPLTAVAITFGWVAIRQEWEAGKVFVWLPFLPILFFFFVLFSTKNDISNFVDEQYTARSKLPFQPMPPPMMIPNPELLQNTPGRLKVYEEVAPAGVLHVPPPALPLQDETFNQVGPHML